MGRTAGETLSEGPEGCVPGIVRHIPCGFPGPGSGGGGEELVREDEASEGSGISLLIEEGKI